MARLRSVWALALASALAAALALAATYNLSVSYSLKGSYSVTASVPPTYYYGYGLSGAFSVAASMLPVATLRLALSPALATVWVSLSPSLAKGYLVSPALATVPYTLYFRFTEPDGTVATEAVLVSGLGSRVAPESAVWTGGVALRSSGPASLLVNSSRDLLAVGACNLTRVSQGVYQLDMQGGRCVLGERVHVVVWSLVDKRGPRAFDLKILLNGTEVAFRQDYATAGHSVVIPSLVNASLGSVYVNGSKVGAGSVPVRLDNGSLFLLTLVAKGRMLVRLTEVKVEPTGTPSFVYVKVSGTVEDYYYGGGIEGARVTVLLGGNTVAQITTGPGGSFSVREVAPRPPGSTLQLSVYAEHDDYEPLTVTTSVAPPSVPVAALPQVPLQLVLLIAVIAAVVAALVLPRVLRHAVVEEEARRRRFVKRKKQQ